MSTFETGGLPGGMPDLAPDDIALVPASGGFWLRVGRQNKTKMIWLSAVAVGKLPAAVAAVVAPVTVTRKRASKTATS